MAAASQGDPHAVRILLNAGMLPWRSCSSRAKAQDDIGIIVLALEQAIIFQASTLHHDIGESHLKGGCQAAGSRSQSMHF